MRKTTTTISSGRVREETEIIGRIEK